MYNSAFFYNSTNNNQKCAIEMLVKLVWLSFSMNLDESAASTRRIGKIGRFAVFFSKVCKENIVLKIGGCGGFLSALVGLRVWLEYISFSLNWRNVEGQKKSFWFSELRWRLSTAMWNWLLFDLFGVFIMQHRKKSWWVKIFLLFNLNFDSGWWKIHEISLVESLKIYVESC